MKYTTFKDAPDRFGRRLTSPLNYTVTVVVTDVGDSRPEWIKNCGQMTLNEGFDIVS